MKTMLSRLLAAGFGAMSLSMLFACAVTGYGVEGGTEVGYVGGYYEPYYEPYGYGYGGWGSSYWVGPGRGGEGGEHRDGRGSYRGGDRGGDRGRAPAYRPAPGGRSAPSIPSRSRGH